MAATERQPLLTGQQRDERDSEVTSQKLDETTPIPSGWTQEYRLLMSYSVPLIGTYLLQYLFQMVIVLVASRLSTDELAGVSLGITTSNIIGFAVFEGMSTALDTLCSHQAFCFVTGSHCGRQTDPLGTPGISRSGGESAARDHMHEMTVERCSSRSRRRVAHVGQALSMGMRCRKKEMWWL